MLKSQNTSQRRSWRLRCWCCLLVLRAAPASTRKALVRLRRCCCPLPRIVRHQSPLFAPRTVRTRKGGLQRLRWRNRRRGGFHHGRATAAVALYALG